MSVSAYASMHGREPESAVVTGLISAAQAGDGRALVLTGPTGIGALCAHLPMPAPGRFRVQWIAGLAALVLLSLAWTLALA